MAATPAFILSHWYFIHDMCNVGKFDEILKRIIGEIKGYAALEANNNP